MGKPAARAGDQTSHGTPLGPAPGSNNVFIGGKPAWRGGRDTHACPLFSGTVAHSSGVVAIGSFTVTINGCPAVRLGDQVVETGPPNAIAAGCESVLIG